MITPVKIAWRIIAVSIAAYAGKLAIGGLVFSLAGPAMENVPEFSETAVPLFAGVLLTVAVLSYPTMLSRLQGMRLYLALFLAMLGLNVILLHVEGVLFLVMEPALVWAAVAMGVLENALLAALMVLAFRDLKKTREQTADLPADLSAGGWAGRIALASFLYVVLYFTAGLLIYPHVREFYETQQMPGGAWFIPYQFLRGAGYVLFTLLLVRSISASRWQCSLSMGLMFPVLAGVAGLLAPNPFMPGEIRAWHILEIGWSNLVFGMIVGYLFWNGAVSEKISESPVHST